MWAGWGWAGSWRPSFQNPLAPSSVCRASYTCGDPRPEQGWTREAVSWGPRALSTAHPQVPIQLVGQKGRHGMAAPASFRVGWPAGQVEKEGPSLRPHDVLNHVVSHSPQRLGLLPTILGPTQARNLHPETGGGGLSLGVLPLSSVLPPTLTLPSLGPGGSVSRHCG